MTRSRASARSAGTAFETSIAGYLAATVDDRIERRRLAGANDRGDLAAVRTRTGLRVVVEAKEYGGRISAGPWLNEAERERVNDGAAVGVVVAKRRGITDPSQQIVLMTVADFATLLTGERP